MKAKTGVDKPSSRKVSSKLPMSCKKSPTETSLEIAVREIGENLAKLTSRLVGDDKLQTKGLIHEFAECKSNCALRHDAFQRDSNSSGEALRLLVARMQAVEEFKSRQEAINKEVEAFKSKIEEAGHMVSGGWKTISTIVAIITPVAGIIGWAIAKYVASRP